VCIVLAWIFVLICVDKIDLSRYIKPHGIKEPWCDDQTIAFSDNAGEDPKSLYSRGGSVKMESHKDKPSNF